MSERPKGEDLFDMAATLYGARKTVRTLDGETWRQGLVPYIEAIRSRAALRGCSDLAAAIELGQQEAAARGVVLRILAAAVEMSDPTPGPFPEAYACDCGHVFPESLGKYGCPDCCGDSGPARLLPAIP